MMSEAFESQVALVTGGANGIGAATIRQFAAGGARTVVADRNGEAARVLQQSLQAQGFESLALECDVSDEAAVKDLFGKVMAEYGRLDMLVNNVGLSVNGPVAGFSDKELQQQLQVNFASVFYGLREALAIMLPAGRGSIVNISSGAGVNGAPGMGLYGAAKAAIINLTKTAAVENFRKGVRVNCVVPGATATEPVKHWAKEHQGGFNKFAEALVPGRFGEPEEIASAIVFLSGPGASYINGEALIVDGGVAAKLSSF